VVDIGAGDGSFARSQNLALRYKNLYLLDHNTESVAALKKEFPKAEVYNVPEKLPFDDRTVSFIHLSHIVEHLEPWQLYTFLGECDRVLIDGGFLVISAPLLWDRFYEDLSHVRPYAPTVFVNYLCSKRANANAKAISDSYQVQELVYRFRAAPAEDGWGSRFFIIDAALRVFRVIISAFGFRRYMRNGFTLVLKKA
jgi:ubiquinone/menaquinone biosynthesis C-methylase UbiE